MLSTEKEAIIKKNTGEEANETSSFYSRRRFLKSSTLIGVGTVLGLQWLSGCKRSDEDLTAIWAELKESLHGELLMPDFSTFKQVAAPWALKYAGNTLPKAIAKCANKQDVRTCILWAKKYSMPLVARSGGHSYAAYSTTTGLMIDISAINTVTYDSVTQLATVGGGARNKNVFSALNDKHVAITHGRCFEVGVAGLTLGGGIGFDMRLNGYTCDKLVETEVVLADGDIIVCSETKNQDLFWACRGAGGGNFGIHTSFTFKTFPVGDITIFDITWTSKVDELFAAVQTLIRSAPDTFGLKLNLNAVKQGGVSVISLVMLGQLAGTQAELSSILAPLFAIQAPAAQRIEVHPYWDGQEIISEEGLPEYAHERSRFINGYLGKSAFDTIIAHLNKWPGNSRGAKWKFFLLGGEIDRKAPADMAMVHRGYTMLSSAEIEYTAADGPDTLAANEAWLDAFHNDMEQYTSAHCYQNFIDADQKNYLDAYYGANLPRLQVVKRKYDPDNVFRYQQSIPL